MSLLDRMARFDLAFCFLRTGCVPSSTPASPVPTWRPPSLSHQDFLINLLLVHCLCSSGVTFNGQ